MFCKYCGKTIDEDSRFCRWCGSVLHSQENPDREEKPVQLPDEPEPVVVDAAANDTAEMELVPAVEVHSIPDKVEQVVVNPPKKTGPVCPRCNRREVQFQTVSEGKKAGCLLVILYVFLAMTVFGLLIVIPLVLRNRTRTVTYAVCQNCGYKWRKK